MVIWICNHLLTYGSGWWLSPTPLKNDGLKVSWDHQIPNTMEKVIQMF